MDILKIKDLVHKILKDEPYARDEDNVLVALVWEKQLDQIGYKGSRDFITILGIDKLSKFESISRCSRKIKENNPALRGSNYIERQQEQSSVVDQLRKFKNEKENEREIERIRNLMEDYN